MAAGQPAEVQARPAGMPRLLRRPTRPQRDSKTSPAQAEAATGLWVERAAYRARARWRCSARPHRRRAVDATERRRRGRVPIRRGGALPARVML